MWTINGGDPIENGAQPDGLTADLTLDPDLGTTPAWGTVHGPFAVNDKVTIGETAALDQAKLEGCSLGAPTISGDGIADDTPLGAGVQVDLAQAANSYTITNPVTCEQSLTLVKTVANDFDGQLLPTDWKLESDAWNQGLFAEMGAGELAFDSGETKTVDVGQYVLSEDDKDNYLFDSLTCEGGDLDADAKTVTVGLGQTVSCTFTNKDAPGSVTWTKVDETGVLLSGSEWKLVGPGGEVAPVEDCEEGDAAQCTGFDKDPAAGKFKVEGLAWGDYTLEEVKAPAGYVINTDPHEFTISKEALDMDFADGIVNVQREVPAIPMTGGLGSFQFWVTAGLLGGLAGGGLLWQRRGQRRTALDS